jgi:hypothetical protein
MNHNMLWLVSPAACSSIPKRLDHTYQHHAELGLAFRQKQRGTKQRHGFGRDAEKIPASLGISTVPGDSGQTLARHRFSIGIGCDEAI